MSSGDHAIIKALPGNDRCMECGMKHPQWASVSFGTVFCLECSGVHRGLGVHISFVRSIAMDSWQEKQLDLMKAGGNGKCASYLSANGILPSTPIKAKYESPVAQHYKEVLKARAQGAPDPPMSKTPAPKPTRVSTSNQASGAPGEDPNGMERMTGESDEQYVARQTRLRNEAKARMAAKFGGGGGRMGGVGSGGIGSKTMSGIGSDSSYNPQTGGYGGGGAGSIDMDTIVSGFCSGFSTLSALGKSGMGTASSVLQDQNSMNQFTGSVKSGGMSIWNSLSSAASDIAMNMTEPDSVGGDGLSDFRAHVQQNKSATSGSKYKGFGSDNWNSGPSSNGSSSNGHNGVSMQSPLNLDFASKKTDNTAPVPRRNPAVVTNNTRTNMDTMKKKMSSDDFFSSFGA